MNPIAIQQQHYDGPPTGVDPKKLEAAKEDDKIESFWLEWSQVQANSEFLKMLMSQRDNLMTILLSGHLNLTETQLRSIITEVATLQRVINAPLTNKGKY